MNEVVVVSAVRTAIAKGKRGGFKDTRPDTLLGLVLAEAVRRGKLENLADIDDVIVGTAMPEAEQGMNVARIGAFMAGLPDSVPASTVNRFCASGLQSIGQGASAILAGWQNVVLAGGVESMSLIAMGGEKPSPNPELMATRPEAYTPMGITAENVASRFGVTREAQDAFAADSNNRALAAIQAGKFVDEILPVKTRVYADGAWKDVTIAVDEGPRASTADGLARLAPAFKQGGSVTAGNSSQVSDGAAAALITSRAYAEAHGLPIRAILRSYQVVGVDPEIMGVGPLYAIPKAVEAAGLTLADIDVFEINEAFAAQALYCVRELGIPAEKVNPNGGAIALGHPLGCTGARQVATLLPELARRNAKRGVVSMCIGGGMGAAGLIELA
jgi:acetyl-CoA acyltransferase